MRKRRRQFQCKPCVEYLESRAMFAATAIDDSYVTEVGVPLHVGDEPARFRSLATLESFAAGRNVEQIEHSAEFELLFLRAGSRLRVLDLDDQSIVSTRNSPTLFKDMSLTSDGRYLFAVDYQPGTRTTFIHRFDSVSRTWRTLDAAKRAWKIEAVSADRVLLQERRFEWDYGLDASVTLNSFPDTGTMQELGLLATSTYGEIEYDSNTALIFQGWLEGSMRSVFVGKVFNDSLAVVSRFATHELLAVDYSSTVLSSDGSHLYYGSLQFESVDVSNHLGSFSGQILAAAPTVAFASGGAYYDTLTSEKLGKLPLASDTLHVSANHQDVWLYNDDEDTIHRFRIEVHARGLLENDQPSAAPDLRIVSNTLPGHGSLSLTPHGQMTYQPNADFSGTDSFSYTVQSISGETSTANVVIDVKPPDTRNRRPTASDKTYHIDQDTDLVIAEAYGDVDFGMRKLTSFDSSGNVRQIEYAPQHELLFVRNAGTQIKIIDVRTQRVIDTRMANGNFRDMDLTPDDNFLFATDNTGGTDYFDPDTTNYVHRFDLVNRKWTNTVSPGVEARIEAVAEDRVLLQELDERALVLSSYSAEVNAMQEVSRLWGMIYINFEYDHRTGLIYHSNGYSKFDEIHILKLEDDTLSKFDYSDLDDTVREIGRTVTMSSDGSWIYYGPAQVALQDVSRTPKIFGQPIYAASDQLAFGKDEVYLADGAPKAVELEFSTGVQFVSGDSGYWWAFNPDTDRLSHYALDGKRVGLLSHAQDPDGDMLTVEILNAPKNGQLGQPSLLGTVSYRPDVGFVGTDQFTYRVFDGLQYSEPATISIHVHSTSVIGSDPSAAPDRYQVQAGHALDVTASNFDGPSLVARSELFLPNAVEQIEVSNRYERIAVRTEEAVEIRHTRTGVLISELRAKVRMTDIDLTPDGRYLFVVDYARERVCCDYTREGPDFVHRYDMVSGQWISKEAPAIAWKIEAVSEDRVLLQEGDLRFDITLNDFGDFASAPVTERSRVRALVSSDFEYDHRTGRIYQGSFGSSFDSIQVQQIVGDQLHNVGDTTPFETMRHRELTSVLASDGKRFYYGGLQVEALEVTNNRLMFPEDILAANEHFAIGESAIYLANDGTKVQELAVKATAAFATDDGLTLWVVCGNTAYEFVSHQQAVAGVLSNDISVEGEPMEARLVSGPANGLLEFASDGSFTYTPTPDFRGVDSFTYVAVTRSRTSAETTVSLVTGEYWHNHALPADVNGDGIISPVDALLVINVLNARTAECNWECLGENTSGGNLVDVNNDGSVSPIDALIVINRLNERSTGAAELGEGEMDEVLQPSIGFFGFTDHEEWWRRKRMVGNL